MKFTSIPANAVLMLFSLSMITCLSCKTKSSPPPAAKIPEALESESYSSSKRMGMDLVAILYRELVDQDPELKEFEADLKSIAENEKDSLANFDNYHQKNKIYYLHAEDHLREVRDSILREHIRNFVKRSEEKYAIVVSNHQNLITGITAKGYRLNDLHEFMKIALTLPVIEKYQLSNLPDKKPMQKIADQYDRMILSADSLLKK